LFHQECHSKQKKIEANKGYDLLNKKSDALKKPFNEITRRILEKNEELGKRFQ
jgi:vacuolar-type H+-ATPase subunit D/Vma8